MFQRVSTMPVATFWDDQERFLLLCQEKEKAYAKRFQEPKMYSKLRKANELHALRRHVLNTPTKRPTQAFLLACGLTLSQFALYDLMERCGSCNSSSSS